MTPEEKLFQLFGSLLPFPGKRSKVYMTLPPATGNDQEVGTWP